jgi:hypothetical protein
VDLLQHPDVRLVVVVDRLGAKDAVGLGFRQPPHDVPPHRGRLGGDVGAGVRPAKVCLTHPQICSRIECSAEDRLPTEVVRSGVERRPALRIPNASCCDMDTVGGRGGLSASPVVCETSDITTIASPSSVSAATTTISHLIRTAALSSGINA